MLDFGIYVFVLLDLLIRQFHNIFLLSYFVVGEVHSISNLKIVNPSQTSHLIITTDESLTELNLEDREHSTNGSLNC